ncbi:transposase [Runella zeae]|uniref:transposase n=1 Tax=Runella zeae TaxID=94255 RepID=UPI000406BBCE|nr:transposase [Runella zeae]
MKFNPKLHHRQSIRLKGYDYSQSGSYFITICARERECIFGEIKEGKTILSHLGQLVEQEWLALPHRFPHTDLDEYVVMPNHFHGIIHIAVGAGLASALESAQLEAPQFKPEQIGPTPPTSTLGDIVCAFKSLVFKRHYDLIRNNHLDEIAKCWQRNYWERIIRNHQEYNNIQNYIISNPERWSQDSDNLERLLSRMTEKKSP